MRLVRIWAGAFPRGDQLRQRLRQGGSAHPPAPTRQGLFFWRRHRISTILASSVSRQSTGSKSPSAAMRVKSRPYLSLALPERGAALMHGLNGSTMLPRKLAALPRSLVISSPASASSGWPCRPGLSSMAHSTCFGLRLPHAGRVGSQQGKNPAPLQASGAMSRGARRRTVPVPPWAATFCSTLGSVTFFACKKCTPAPARPAEWPAANALYLPARAPFPSNAKRLVQHFAAGREKPLKRYCILVHCPSKCSKGSMARLAQKTSAARFVPERFFPFIPCRFAVQHHPGRRPTFHVKRGGPPFAIVQHRAVLQRIHQWVSAVPQLMAQRRAKPPTTKTPLPVGIRSGSLPALR